MKAAAERITVFLADDHPIFLAGLHHLLSRENDIDIVGEANNGAHAAAQIVALRPRLALVDLLMPDLNGIGVLQQLGRAAVPTRTMILTVSDDPGLASQAIRLGARGYMLKRSARENLLFAIRSVDRNGLYIDPLVAGRMMDAAGPRTSSARLSAAVAAQQLTHREADVLRRIALGYTTKEIAGQIGVTQKSVETYKVRATDKLQLGSRAKIVQFAMLQGWFESSDAV